MFSINMQVFHPSYSTIVLYIRDIEGVGAIRDITQNPTMIFPHNDMTVLVG